MASSSAEDEGGIRSWAVRRSGNRLLDRLPLADLELLQTQFVPVILTMGSQLEFGDRATSFAVFPCDSTVLSLQIATEDGRAVEALMVGAEGVVGQPSDLTGLRGLRCQVLAGGPGLKVEASRLAAAAAAAPSLQALLDGYRTALLGQAMQAAACAALHQVEERTCRRLLELHDRIGRAELPMTQEALADALGVRRTTITRIIAGLEERGLVQHRRSRVLVLDRKGLEAASCECHGAVAAMFARLVPGLYPSAGG
ncbi:Crp/Fnr family transcriptional regulator [Siccirubricoccus phaeus]|uniref:Crp/Fnr family transcriptional regulator n=1 Tax=Siccirubricoccus phaeus TaxID=2595053 RepID=UPI0011F1168A|nr:helix-turn-helix domain-containing protein [Siccirubricoccus phaeus]